MKNWEFTICIWFYILKILGLHGKNLTLEIINQYSKAAYKINTKKSMELLYTAN